MAWKLEDLVCVVQTCSLSSLVWQPLMGQDNKQCDSELHVWKWSFKKKYQKNSAAVPQLQTCRHSPWLTTFNQRIWQSDAMPSCFILCSAGTDACRSSGFIGGGQTVKFFFDAPPCNRLLWACLLAWASRDLYPACLWFARAPIPHPICSSRDTGLSRCTNRNLAVISQSVFLPPSPSRKPLHLTPLYFLLGLNILRYNYCSCLQMFLSTSL